MDGWILKERRDDGWRDTLLFEHRVVRGLLRAESMWMWMRIHIFIRGLEKKASFFLKVINSTSPHST